MFAQINDIWFVFIFHLVGGYAVGSFLRGLVRGKFSCQSIFFLVWGTLFGGIPLIAGFIEFEKIPFLLPAQIFVFAATIITVAFLPDILIESLNTPPSKDMILGGICAVIGVGSLIALLADPTDWFLKGLVGGVFGVAGIGMIVGGLKKLIHEE